MMLSRPPSPALILQAEQERPAIPAQARVAHAIRTPTPCPVCRQSFTPTGRGRFTQSYCSVKCRRELDAAIRRIAVFLVVEGVLSAEGILALDRALQGLTNWRANSEGA